MSRGSDRLSADCRGGSISDSGGAVMRPRG
jgi:hypothetical protein